jgi:hypothetical protein
MGSNSDQNCFGFVTVRLHPEHGYLGGLLIVNASARPLEFHCSLPLIPKKSQSILYGPTLDEFICGEQIARALIAKSKSKPALVFTDASSVLSLRNVGDAATVFIDSSDESEETKSLAVRPAISEERLHRFSFEEYQLATLSEYRDDAKRFMELWRASNPQIDLREPFGRIAEALLEAHPSSRAA